MKLSKLEALVKLMRDHATNNGVEDPNVEFYDGFSRAELEIVTKSSTFIEMELKESLLVPGEINNHVCFGVKNVDLAIMKGQRIVQKGDYHLPLYLVSK